MRTFLYWLDEDVIYTRIYVIILHIGIFLFQGLWIYYSFNYQALKHHVKEITYKLEEELKQDEEVPIRKQKPFTRTGCNEWINPYVNVAGKDLLLVNVLLMDKEDF